MDRSARPFYVASDVHARAYDAHRQRSRIQYPNQEPRFERNLGLENQISANVEKHVACPQSCVRSWLSIALIIWHINSFCLIRWCLEVWSPSTFVRENGMKTIQLRNPLLQAAHRMVRLNCSGCDECCGKYYIHPRKTDGRWTESLALFTRSI